MLLIIGTLDVLYSSFISGILIISLLSFTMGTQNAASTRISGSKVRTTHVSGIATDIGLGLALLLQTSEVGMRILFKQRFQVHLTPILSFTIGGIVGVFSYKVFGGGMYWVASLLLFLLSAKYLANRTI